MSPNEVKFEPAQNLHLVFLVHGIRTIMTWRRVLRREVATIPGTEAQTFFYGFFSLLQFYVPWLRERIVR